jgi:DNA helicase HerA-like ATPase
MLYDNKIWVGGTSTKCFIEPSKANRHGLIAGATGTGKSVTLKVLAESFSDMGVPVFLADVKGDMSGICAAGVTSDSMEERIAKFGIENFEYKAYPTTFYDVFGQMGIPMRTTISELGPILLGRMLGLSDVQRAVMSMVFRIADDQGLLLLDLKDLRLLLTYIGDHADDYKLTYGNISSATIGAIQRNLALLSDEGADAFFAEPAFNVMDFFKTGSDGRGMINVLNATELFNKPLLYSTFLLWLLSEIYENMPEVGDPEKPKMVFFFDEAHLLFNDAPAFLLEKIDQIVRLIRSKGIGVYFISQSPSDIPDTILAQLQNRVQHALRAYTPAEQKKLKAAAESFRANPGFDTEAALSELAVGEALVSFLDAKGTPGIVERAYILPPQSFIGSAGFEKIQELTDVNPLYEKYRVAVDPESAYEILMRKYDPNYGAAAAPAAEAAPFAESAAAAPVAAVPTAADEEKARLAAEKQAEKERAAEIREDREADRKQRELDRQEDRERRLEERERAAEIREQKERDRQEDRERREAERQARAEERERKELERQEEKAKREAERAKKNSPVTKIVNSATTAAGRQIGSSLIRGIFGSLLKK